MDAEPSGVAVSKGHDRWEEKVSWDHESKSFILAPLAACEKDGLKGIYEIGGKEPKKKKK